MDEILKDFLETQRTEGLRLADESDLLELTPIDDQSYVATFSCKSLVRDADGEVHEHDRFGVAIRFPENYLRHVNPGEILTWLGPKEIWHPNIGVPGAPFICLGTIVPGTPLVDLLHRCFEVITFENVVMREDDALNRPACAWARRNRDRFPIDTRPIKRRALPASIEVAEVSP
jgi:hypothetical protein